MDLKRHPLRRRAFKGMLLVAGLAFFIIQTSYKFYVFASLPALHAKDRSHDHHAAFGSRATVIHTSPGGVVLSLDKRYEVKSHFAFPAPLFQADHFIIADTPRSYIYSDKPVRRIPVTSLLRGPPATAVIV